MVIAGAKGFDLEAGDSFDENSHFQCGAGDVDGISATVSWRKPTAPPRKPHSIWQHLLDNGTPGQIARLKDDPGLQPDAPVLTVELSSDGTRGFSIGLEQLQRHKAMWLPEHDAFITLADTPVDFAAHLASLKGERVLERVMHEPEATLAEWSGKWADFGDPTKPHHGQETEWLGTKGLLTGFAARHGSVYKFGVDRMAKVRPDLASPHKFRFDPLWQDAKWVGQHAMASTVKSSNLSSHCAMARRRSVAKLPACSSANSDSPAKRVRSVAVSDSLPRTRTATRSCARSVAAGAWWTGKPGAFG
jgi:hypothetical protein